VGLDDDDDDDDDDVLDRAGLCQLFNAR